jgi:hypothetical protein
MDSYIKLTPDDQRSFRMYCLTNNLVNYYKEKDHILIEGLFTLYARELIRKLERKQEK